MSEAVLPFIDAFDKNLVFGLDYIKDGKEFKTTEVGFHRIKQILESKHHHKIDLLDIEFVSVDSSVVKLNTHWRYTTYPK